MKERRFFTTYQIGQLLGVSRHSVINWIEKGGLLAHRTPGGHRRVRREDLVEFLQKHKIPIPEVLQYRREDILEDITAGRHSLFLYEKTNDLLLIMPAYFREGVERNFLSLWIKPDELPFSLAEKALKQEIPELKSYLRQKKFSLVNSSSWYGKEKFSPPWGLEKIEELWKEVEKRNLKGLKIAGDPTCLVKKCWRELIDYEGRARKLLRGKKIIALCSYWLKKLDGVQIGMLFTLHRMGVIRVGGVWNSLVQTRTLEN